MIPVTVLKLRVTVEINNWLTVSKVGWEIADVDFERINQQKKNLIKKLNPSKITAGTQILNENVIRHAINKIFNLYGGDPTKYRGLDPICGHLAWWFWLYCYNFHQVEKTFWHGSIAWASSANGVSVSQFGYWNTQVCVEMSFDYETIALGTAYTLTPQTTLGRYYSFMPGALKQACVSKFEKWRGGFWWEKWKNSFPWLVMIITPSIFFMGSFLNRREKASETTTENTFWLKNLNGW